MYTFVFTHAKQHCRWLHFAVVLNISTVLLEDSWSVNWTNPSFLPVKWHLLQSKAADYRSEGKFLNKFIQVLWAIKNILGKLLWHLKQKKLFRLWPCFIGNWTRCSWRPNLLDFITDHFQTSQVRFSSQLSANSCNVQRANQKKAVYFAVNQNQRKRYDGISTNRSISPRTGTNKNFQKWLTF